MLVVRNLHVYDADACCLTLLFITPRPHFPSEKRQLNVKENFPETVKSVRMIKQRMKSMKTTRARRLFQFHNSRNGLEVTRSTVTRQISLALISTTNKKL